VRITLSAPAPAGTRSPAHGPAGLDVDVLPGLPAGQLRRRLAVLTGEAAWAAPGTVLTVAGRALDDTHPAGAPPLLPGAVVGRDRGPTGPRDGADADDALAAAGTDAHVAVVAGPDAGRLLPLAEGAHARLHGPAAPARRRSRTHRDEPQGVPRPDHGRSAGLLLADPVLTGVVLEVVRRGRRVRVRTLAAPRGAGRVAAGRSVPRRWPSRRWRPGQPLRIGGTTVVVRGPGVTRDRTGRPPRVPPWAWTTVASTSGAVALAVAMRQPLLLLTAGVGLLGLVAVLRAPGSGGPAGAPGTATSGTDATGDGPTPPRDVAELRLATARGLHGRPEPVPGDPEPWPADGTLALVGPRASTLPVARALTLRTLGAATPTALVVRAPDDPAAWSWTRWWSPSSTLPGQGVDVLVVADGCGNDLAAWRSSVGPRARLLLVVTEGAAAPAWASTVLQPPAPRVGTPQTRRRPRRPGGSRRAVQRGRGVEGVSATLAEAQARAAAALSWQVDAVSSGTCAPSPAASPGGQPTPVLGALPGVPGASVAGVADAWRASTDPRRLAATLGVDPRRPAGDPVVVDLVRDGPHALVAGTTGAGKSELLTTLVLALALTHPPARLALLLVDFKGGTGLGPLAGLPHVIDHVHDLDVATARRTLTGLRAEVRRREHLLAAAGRTDLAELDPVDPATPGRLLVVVDELRAMVDDLPEASATLARLAAQGRALGVHLVLATQRPAGAVPADLRANVNLRVALRVADEADSRDVLGVPDAAALDPASPGRALLRVGPRPTRAVQVARARHGRAPAPVRLVAAGPPSWRPDGAADDPAVDDVAHWVAACRGAARGTPGSGVPWVPGLPARLPADAVGAAATADGLLVAVADLPAEQRRADVRWRLDGAPLLVLGGPRSGRSTALLTVGTHALHAGAHVHAVGLPEQHAAALRGVDDDGVGTVLPLDDLHRCVLLLDRLARRDTTATPEVLLLDGLDVLLDELARHARGLGADLLASLLRRPPPGVHVAASGPVVAALTRLTGTFPTRLVLPLADPALDPQAGVPTAFAGPRCGAGRAVASTPTAVAEAQVVLPSSAAVHRPAERHVPLRVARLPRRAAPPAGARPGTLGSGGVDGASVEVDVTRPLLVAGPPGSGRTTALRTLARSLASDGRRVALVVPAAAPGTAPVGADLGRDRPGGTDHTTADALVVDAERLVELLADASDPTALVVDDLDELERRAPGAAEHLERSLRDGGPHVLAVATSTEHAATAFRGAAAAVLRHGQLLVLDPHGPAAADLLGAGHALHTDPGERVPGRGVLRRDRTLVRVQVHDAPPIV
jgi:S-DNA-T family DNA segregation ATPase FtsK/SpoIIIE